MALSGTERARRYRSRKKRMLVARDGEVCRICHHPIDPEDMENIEVDHRLPVARGGTDDPDNLQLSHKDCNRAKGDRPQGSPHRQLDMVRHALKSVVSSLQLGSPQGARLALAIAREAMALLEPERIERPPATATGVTVTDNVTHNGQRNGNGNGGLLGGGRGGPALASESSLGPYLSKKDAAPIQDPTGDRARTDVEVSPAQEATANVTLHATETTAQPVASLLQRKMTGTERALYDRDPGLFTEAELSAIAER